jgi:hypothetical protein
MREDMYKVIVERPRHYKGNDTRAARRRNDADGPQHLGMRVGYGYRALNENLNPLRRYLHAQVGRPWDKVFSEIAARIDRRNTVQQHIYQHIDDFIAIDVTILDGQLIDLREPYPSRSRLVRQPLYVDPRTGLIRPNKTYGSWRREAAQRKRAWQAEIDLRRRVLDENTQLLLLAGEWFEVKVARLPDDYVVEVIVNGRKILKKKTEQRFDVVQKRMVSWVDTAEGEKLYGCRRLYAVTKRQLSRQELRAHELR